MAKLTFQQLKFNKGKLEPAGEPFPVAYNPTEFTLTKSASYADIAIPGLDSPVVQFVRGEAEKLSLELFFDSTDISTNGSSFTKAVSSAVFGSVAGKDDDDNSVTKQVDKFYRLIKIKGKLHAPAVVRVAWGEHFPNTASGYETGATDVFDCVVESVSRQFTLFSSEGEPLRCTVTISLRQYKTLESQLDELNLQSADHTRVHIIHEGETLPQIAHDAYQDVSRWRLIAEHNNILNPREIKPGMVLNLPPTI